MVRLLIAHASGKGRRALADVVTAGSGGEPLEILETGDGGATLDLLLQDDPPELALVDWDLPGIEGPEVCRLLRDFHHGLDSYLIVLASSRHTDAADALEAGAADCVSTPASPAALRAAVENGVLVMRASRADAAGLKFYKGDADRGAGGGSATLDDDRLAKLDALRTPDGEAAGVFVCGVTELRAGAVPDASLRSWGGAREAEEPRGHAVLEAVLGER